MKTILSAAVISMALGGCACNNPSVEWPGHIGDLGTRLAIASIEAGGPCSRAEESRHFKQEVYGYTFQGLTGPTKAYVKMYTFERRGR